MDVMIGLLSQEEGQGMVEYILIFTMIVVVTVVTLGTLGTSLSAYYSSIISHM